ncbi:lactate utilization protein C [Pseudogracilibacillus sp. SE30717A]|uniref:LutC/YkgG family protein n=1 Tax=Pseudogracilibacillus sp. SE30717A TaxID=3098293 RepID=UPI00300DEBED
MIQNREEFLNRIANQLNRPRQKNQVIKPVWKNQPQWEVMNHFTKDELVDVLEEQCKVIHTTFKKTSKENLPTILHETIIEYGGGPIISSKDERNVRFGLDRLYKKLTSDGVEVREWCEDKRNENVRYSERANIGITFSDLTLAESGTVTLFNDKANSRTISLLPVNYIAIIPKETLVPRMSHATRLIHEKNKNGELLPSCISFITGPSNSADIELNLVVGVHGPVQASYIIIE